MTTLLIANRGEIAVRIIEAAVELGWRSVAVFAPEDAGARHVRLADHAVALDGRGAQPYLDAQQLLEVARANQCTAVHPGYGFLSEQAEFARRVEAAGLIFVGPTPEAMATLGDKLRARALAAECGVPVLPGTSGATTLAEARDFLAALGPGGALVLKAVAGGGGRGMRVVRDAAQLDAAYARCRSEAEHAFGDGSLYAEALFARARHIEVQIVGDGSGAVIALGERECSLQRRHQKLIEIAPCPSLAAGLRARLCADAVRLAAAVRYRNAGTIEFLVGPAAGDDAEYAFIEANPRLQVEHTVTEAVHGIDLVRAQLLLATGSSLADALPPPSPASGEGRGGGPRGYAIQLRLNAETLAADGTARPSGGRITAFELPSGPGVRVDTAAGVGYQPSPHFDSLLAKLVVHAPAPDFAAAATRAARALGELRVTGTRHNAALLRALITHPDVVANRLYTQFVDDHLAELLPAEDAERPRALGADPLAVLAYGKGAGDAEPVGDADADLPDDPPTLDGELILRAAMPGTIVSLEAAAGATVHGGQALLVMNAMKMEHVVEAPSAGVLRGIAVEVGDTVGEGQALAVFLPGEGAAASAAAGAARDLDHIRPDLAELLARRAKGEDAARPDAVAKRRKSGQRTARENLADLLDADSFIEYGGFAIAAQRQRRSLDDLIARTPGDGLLAGIGRVNGELVGAERAACAVLSYDYTVLAGTQGFQNHRKKDRLFELIERLRLPVVFFTEGGGGRPGDTDAPGVAGLDCMAFALFGGLSGLVPMVGINSGRCFAGNAALLGCCDVIIATANSNIGMGGPAMIEGGGLGVFRPEEVGPMATQVPNGVVDVAVADEAEAVRVAKQYLAYFQGPLARWECADQRQLRHAVPENRLRVYDVRTVIDGLADRGSVLELRRGFGLGMITALARVEGRPLGIVANNPRHLSGAIDSPGADKAARFLQLCDAFDLPVLFLCDTPGMMVGPEVETTALVRHCSRLFVTGASLTVPFFTIVLRKGYGLGAQAMAGGSFKAGLFTVAWPTGEFGGMGLEGAVKLGFRKELEAVADPEQRRQLFEHMVARAYEHGRGLNMASHFEIDAVIDPAESRHWIATAMRSAPPPPPRTHKKRPCIDTW
ncbi:MAG: carboxyl transferase domain-containing protein [Deltaproteobacteria bacterium]|nr:carboxyl transferase domain-containing protein [Deltaproteobacteria bacterium]